MDMTDDKPRKISLRFTDQEFEALDDKRHGLRTSFQKLGHSMFMKWLREKPEEKTVNLSAEVLDLAKDFSAHSGVGVSEVIENSVRQYAGTQYVLGNAGGIDVNVPLRKNRSTTTPSDDLSVMLQWAKEVLLAVHPASVALAWNIATFRGAVIATAEEEHEDHDVSGPKNIPDTEEKRLRLAEQILERIVANRKASEKLAHRAKQGGRSVSGKRPA